MLPPPGSEIIAARLGGLLDERRMTIAVAESCTGGMIGAAITGIAGSSRYFRGGIISYVNDAKETLLHVPPGLLREHGAVSGPVAEAMACGAQRLLGADCAIAVTGIAGPGGATAGKPVGLVFIALRIRDSSWVYREQFSGDRHSVRSQTVVRGLQRLVDNIEKSA